MQSTENINMLSISELEKRYNNEAVLTDINFTCSSGEIIAIIGPSGCGKSTLLNILAGNIKEYNGEVLLNDKPLNHRQMSIGLIAQDYGLLPWRNVYSNVILPLKIKKLPISQYTEKIDFVLKRLQIDELKKRYPNQLSGGQKQRVSIAKTFIMDLELLLMDEPFSALDTITKEQTQQLFLDIWKEQLSRTLFVTHSIEEAVFLGKKILVLSKCPGRIINIIDNPSFGIKNPHDKHCFHEVCTHIRNVIKEEWGT